MQSWVVDYPLLAYKTFTPNNKEIAIIHLCLNMPQRIVHLGEWEFVSFVNHTQMIEQRCFYRWKETNCDILFLVRHTKTRKIRLMSYKSNPWLHFYELPNEADTDIIKQAIYIFSGKVSQIPTEDSSGDVIESTGKNIKRFSRRFNNDKIQTVQLITKPYGSYEQYMLIIQFNDCIVQASLNKSIFKIICQPSAMIRRHLVRGYNEKIFYAEVSGNTEKIQQLEFHNFSANELVKKEIFTLSGSMVAFEADSDCI